MRTGWLGLAAILACSKSEPPKETPPIPEPEARTVCACESEALSAPGFFFIGTYLDAKCSTQPVAHTDFAACATADVGSSARVFFVDASGSHKASDRADVPISRMVTPDEALRMYRKGDDGRCEPYEPKGLKLVPAGCTGRRVCRDASGNLACTGCKVVSNGCPNYQGARAFALLAEATAAPARARPVAPVATAGSGDAPAPAASPNGCDDPFVIDARGVRHRKPECR